MERPRVLVVEDDRSIREGIADALSFHGFSAIQAERGDVGIEKALHGGCDLVILDIVLPGADGMAVLREVRKARPTLPVILLTARGLTPHTRDSSSSRETMRLAFVAR